MSYLRPRSDLMLLSSDFATVEKWVRFLFCFLVFLVKMWLLKACFLLIFPDPVRANLFLAPELVLTFGIFVCLKLLIRVICQHVAFLYLFLGESMIIILFPSRSGICSTFPYSSRSFAKRSSNTSPCSLKRMDRPLKNTYALTFDPS